MFYQELTTYSPLTDCRVTRLSMTNERGGEYFALIKRGQAKVWRKHKETALDAIAEAVSRGDEPGEISLTLET